MLPKDSGRCNLFQIESKALRSEFGRKDLKEPDLNLRGVVLDQKHYRGIYLVIRSNRHLLGAVYLLDSMELSLLNKMNKQIAQILLACRIKHLKMGTCKAVPLLIDR